MPLHPHDPRSKLCEVFEGSLTPSEAAVVIEKLAERGWRLVPITDTPFLSEEQLERILAEIRTGIRRVVDTATGPYYAPGVYTPEEGWSV